MDDVSKRTHSKDDVDYSNFPDQKSKTLHKDEELLQAPRFGQIYIVRQSIGKIFGSILLDRSASGSSSSKSSTSSKKTSDRAKKRPCIVWKTVPNIEIMIMSRFNDVKVDDPSIILHETLPNEYILKRLLPIHPKPALNDRKPIVTVAKENRAVTVINTYLVLIPIVIENSNELKKLVPEYFSEEDLYYINSLLLKIAIEESEEKIKIIQQMNYKLTINNDNKNSNDNESNNDNSSQTTGSSLPTVRSYLIDRNEPNKEDRIKKWLTESSFDDIDDSMLIQNILPLSSPEISEINIIFNGGDNNETGQNRLTDDFS